MSQTPGSIPNVAPETAAVVSDAVVRLVGLGQPFFALEATNLAKQIGGAMNPPVAVLARHRDMRTVVHAMLNEPEMDGWTATAVPVLNGTQTALLFHPDTLSPADLVPHHNREVVALPPVGITTGSGAVVPVTAASPTAAATNTPGDAASARLLLLAAHVDPQADPSAS